MRAIVSLSRRLWSEEKAEVAIEYGLLLALIILALITALAILA